MFICTELALFSLLDDISRDLVQLDPKDGSRRARLSELLRSLSRSARGLYFACNIFLSNSKPSQRHHEILRVLENEAIPLNSRDKAPFLLQVEVATTSNAALFAHSPSNPEQFLSFVCVVCDKMQTRSVWRFTGILFPFKLQHHLQRMRNLPTLLVPH